MNKPLFEHKIIKRQNGEDYLERWAFNTPLFCIKIHKIIASDDYCMHDHPWAYKSLILKGGYIELTPLNNKRNFERRETIVKYMQYDFKYPLRTVIKPGTLISRPGKHIHRLVLNKRADGSEIPCWTFVLTGARKQEWGFYTKTGWIKWFKYVGSRDCN